MKAFASVALILFGVRSIAAGLDTGADARALERKGDALGARTALRQAVRANPQDVTALQSYAEFLDRYEDPEARDVYREALAALKTDSDARARDARRLVLLDLIVGDRSAAESDFAVYRKAGGKDWPDGVPQDRGSPEPETIAIPGPLRSFSRMAGLSPELAARDVLPSLARAVVTNGYQTSTNGEALETTEYMKLIGRYLAQARELTKFAGAPGTIRIETCDSSQARELLQILGYRVRGGCGSELVLETADAGRAFLTVDSGFPLAHLEQALRAKRPFIYGYKATRVPLLYGTDFWLAAKGRQNGEFIDTLLGDPTLCRAYLGIAKLDPATADAFFKSITIGRIKAFAHVLDFFGGMFLIRDGKAVVPGGGRAAAIWAELVGVSPGQGAAFFDKLMAMDGGWLASYYDALACVNGPVKEYLTDPQRLKRFYLAIRGQAASPGLLPPVLRSNTDMMLLTTRLRLGPDGKPHIPGSLEEWRNLIVSRPGGKHASPSTRATPGWKDPDDVLEALFGLCLKLVDNEPLKIFMALSDLDRERAKPFDPATVDRLIQDFPAYGSQYPIFSESPGVSDQTVVRYLDAARAVSRNADTEKRADAAGIFQALAGLWAIFCRQGSIPLAEADPTLAGIVAPFAEIRSQSELFDAGRNGVMLLLKAGRSPEAASPQDRIIELLAGTSKTNDAGTQAQLMQDMIRIFEAQRLMSLDFLFQLNDNIAAGSKERLNTVLLGRLTAHSSETEAPRAGLTTREKNVLSFGYWAERHIETERRIDIVNATAPIGSNADQLREFRRGLLVPFLRDTLVGLNYVHYAPPGAQLLLTNPLFVRSHDFVGMSGSNQTWKPTQLAGAGWPSSFGGRLMGSLANLPYALAGAEQNFLVPSHGQALVWGDLVPQLILSAKIPRWWTVTPAQLHWVGLHMRVAESLLAEAAFDPALRGQIENVLGQFALPARVSRVESMLSGGHVRMAIENITPCEMFIIARQTLDHGHGTELFAADIRRLQQDAPNLVNYQAISRAFGTPKPTLTNSYRPELLYLRTFPTLMGYSSRIMAESWESSTLYWAALADAVHVPPSQLNLLIPEWTEQTVERIFATHMEDWPELLRSLRAVGEDVRLKAWMQMDTGEKAFLQ